MKKKPADLKGEEKLCDEEYCLNDSYGEYNVTRIV